MTQSWIILQKDGLQLADGTLASLEHRVVYEGGRFYGVENLVKGFEHDDAGWSMFLGQLLILPMGTYNNLFWKAESVEDCAYEEEKSKAFMKQVQEETNLWLERNNTLE